MTIWRHKKGGQLYTIEKVRPKNIDTMYWEARPHQWNGRVLRCKTQAELDRIFEPVRKK